MFGGGKVGSFALWKMFFSAKRIFLKHFLTNSSDQNF
jgi:hypothetical protein